MRVVTGLFVLLALPLAAAAAQNRGQSAANVSADGKCATADANRSPNAGQNRAARTDPHGRARTGCSPASGAPSQPPPGGGSVSIHGSVFNPNTGARLAGWVVDVEGPVTASAVSDESGAFWFSGLPPGTYTVCQLLQTGWTQTIPSSSGVECLTGFGYRFTLLTTGQTASGADFGNVR